MKQIPDDFLRKLRTEVYILDVAEQYFSLTQIGNVYQTSCIHGKDTSPSLTFFPQTNTFYCFGCGAGKKPKTEGSSVIDLVMWLDNCSFMEAVLKLSNMKGCQVPRKGLSPEDKKRQQQLDEAIIRNRTYWQDLQENEDYIKYLEERGITQEDIDKWRIGSVPDDENYFSNRLVFALMNDWGQTVGFSYRNMSDQFDYVEDEGAKYVNSKKSLVFDKGSVLYGMNFVKRKIRELGYVIVGEGFGDAILAQKADLPFVSTMGTSLTDNQIDILAKYTDTVILWMDGDNAGIQATLRHAEALQKRGFIVKVLNIPGKDPDNVLMELQGSAEKYVQHHAMLASQYKIQHQLSMMDSQINEIKLRTLRQIKPIMDTLPDDDEKMIFMNHLVNRFDLSKELLHVLKNM